MDKVTNEKWQIVKHRCHLDEEEIWMAKKLHFTPDSIMKLARSKDELWKDTVPLRIRRLFDQKFGPRSRMK